jgi:hypothetical protein
VIVDSFGLSFAQVGLKKHATSSKRRWGPLGFEPRTYGL